MTNQHQKQRRPGRSRGIWAAAIGLALAFAAMPLLHAQDDLGSDKLFAGTEQFAKGSTGSTEVTLDKNALKMAGKALLKDQGNDGDLVNLLDLVEVRGYEYASPGQYKLEDVQKFSKKLDGDGWAHIVRVRSATESTDVCFRGGNNGEPSELVVIDAEPTELTFVHLVGHLSLDELGKMAQQYGTPALKARPH